MWHVFCKEFVEFNDPKEIGVLTWYQQGVSRAPTAPSVVLSLAAQVLEERQSVYSLYSYPILCHIP